MTRRLAGIAALIVLFAGAAHADPIEGRWRTPSGATARVSPCAQAYCVTLETGRYSGRRIGHLAPGAKGYEGELTDPKTDKTYRGKGQITGDALTVSGCIFGGLICRGETWTRL